MQVQLHQGGTLFHSDASNITERGWGLYREKENINSVEIVEYFRAAGGAHVKDRIAAISKLADETMVWHPHRDGNSAISLVTDTVTPVFRFDSVHTDSAYDRVLKLGVSPSKAAVSSNDAASEDGPGTYGPNYCPMPRSLEEAQAQYSQPNPTTVTEARALEAERPLTAEEACKSGTHTWGRVPQSSKLSPGERAWIDRLSTVIFREM